MSSSSQLIGKKELLSWAQSSTGIVCTTYGHLRDGLVLLALAQRLYPMDIPMETITLQRRGPRNDARNWQLLQDCMVRNGLPRHLTGRKAISVGHSRHCYNSLVMFYFLHRLADNDSNFSVDFTSPVDPNLARFLQSSSSRAALGEEAEAVVPCNNSSPPSSCAPADDRDTSPSPIRGDTYTTATPSRATPTRRSRTAARSPSSGEVEPTPTAVPGDQVSEVSALRDELLHVRATAHLVAIQQRGQVEAELERASSAFQADLLSCRRSYADTLEKERQMLRKAYAALSAETASPVPAPSSREVLLLREAEQMKEEMQRLYEALAESQQSHAKYVANTRDLFHALRSVSLLVLRQEGSTAPPVLDVCEDDADAVVGVADVPDEALGEAVNGALFTLTTCVRTLHLANARLLKSRAAEMMVRDKVLAKPPPPPPSDTGHHVLGDNDFVKDVCAAAENACSSPESPPELLRSHCARLVDTVRRLQHRQHDAVSPLEESQHYMSMRTEKLQLALQETEQKLSAAQARMEVLQRRSQETPAAMAAPPRVECTSSLVSASSAPPPPPYRAMEAALEEQCRTIAHLRRTLRQREEEVHQLRNTSMASAKSDCGENDGDGFASEEGALTASIHKANARTTATSSALGRGGTPPTSSSSLLSSPDELQRRKESILVKYGLQI